MIDRILAPHRAKACRPSCSTAACIATAARAGRRRSPRGSSSPACTPRPTARQLPIDIRFVENAESDHAAAWRTGRPSTRSSTTTSPASCSTPPGRWRSASNRPRPSRASRPEESDRRLDQPLPRQDAGVRHHARPQQRHRRRRPLPRPGRAACSGASTNWTTPTCERPRPPKPEPAGGRWDPQKKIVARGRRCLRIDRRASTIVIAPAEVARRGRVRRRN